MKEIKTISDAGIVFLSKEEGGVILCPYLDTAGIATISIGCTYYASGIRVTMKDPPLTKSEAIALFETVLRHYEDSVWSLTRDDISQNMFNALVSITYNIGVANFKNSSLLKKLNINKKRPFDHKLLFTLE